MNGKSCFILAGFIVLTLCAGCNKEDPKIGVVDVAKVINDSKRGKQANAELEALLKDRQAAANEKAESVDRLKKSLDKEPAATKKAKDDELNRLAQEYQRMVATSEAEIQKKAGELRNEIAKEIRNVLVTVGREEKYLVIMTAEGAPYHQETIEITDKIIRRYNESN
ncbi:MAG: OmpH family outer membrane protein [Syntrophobacteraceae bacterium]